MSSNRPVAGEREGDREASEAPLVLVIDDDGDIRELVCELLEEEGFRVTSARDGMEALRRVDEERPSAILLDLKMPVMDGATFARVLRRQPARCTIPILVITADGTEADAEAIGATGFLQKPFGIARLLSHLKAVIDGREPSSPERPAEGMDLY